jgi:cytochrome c oxidase subunit IV
VRLRPSAYAIIDRMTAQTRKLLVWALLGALAALVSYFGFRAYMAPELLLNFGNTLYC